MHLPCPMVRPRSVAGTHHSRPNWRSLTGGWPARIFAGTAAPPRTRGHHHRATRRPPRLERAAGARADTTPEGMLVKQDSSESAAAGGGRQERLPGFLDGVIAAYPEVWRAYQQLGDAAGKAGPLDLRAQRLVKLALAVGARSPGRGALPRAAWIARGHPGRGVAAGAVARHLVDRLVGGDGGTGLDTRCHRGRRRPHCRPFWQVTSREDRSSTWWSRPRRARTTPLAAGRPGGAWASERRDPIGCGRGSCRWWGARPHPSISGATAPLGAVPRKGARSRIHDRGARGFTCRTPGLPNAGGQ